MRHLALLPILALLACEEAAPLDSEATTPFVVEVVVYDVSSPAASAEVDLALDAGAEWDDLEEAGLVRIQRVDWLPFDRHFEDLVQVSGGTVADGSVLVGPGLFVDFRYPALSGATYIFNVFATNSKTGKPVQDDFARSDFYRFTDSWEWKGSSDSKGGRMSGSLVCGSRCSKIRLKMANRSTNATHRYTFFIDVG